MIYIDNDNKLDRICRDLHVVQIVTVVVIFLIFSIGITLDNAIHTLMPYVVFIPLSFLSVFTGYTPNVDLHPKHVDYSSVFAVTALVPFAILIFCFIAMELRKQGKYILSITIQIPGTLIALYLILLPMLLFINSIDS